MNRRSISRGLIFIIILIGAIALFSLLWPTSNKPTKIPLSEAIAMSQSGNIEKVVVDGGESTLLITARVEGDAPLVITTIDDEAFDVYSGTELTTDIGDLNMADLKELGFILPANYITKSSSGFNWGGLLINFLPLLLFGGLLFFLFRSARGANSQAMSFGRSRARLFPANRPTVTFDDVAGVEEAKQELHEVVDFLKSREKFQILGARIPKGVLVVGPPGTGKTLMARAVAGEANVPFFSISGSEFVEMFVGVGASRVRDLFDQAKRNTPCIIFIDEIDAVGRHRGAGLGGSHDEREQTLNQILVEMDGFDTNLSVIVLAATNRPDILDPALLRPGRFDRRVILDRPDINGRLGILKVHSKGKPLNDSVDLEVLAKQTAGFSGADLANLVNEAAILAARRNKKNIEMQELEESIDRVIAGPERKSRKISAKEKEVTAYHEAGHALVARMLPNADPVHKISIVARGMMGGYTRLLPTEDRYLMTRAQFKDMLATLLAGHGAEQLVFNEMTTGSQNDIEQATKLARKMVTDYGMSDKLGPRTFGHKEELVFLGREISEQRDYSEKIAQQIDDEVFDIIQKASEVAKGILTKNRPILVKLAEKLIEKETIEGEELDAIFGELPPPAPPETVPTPAPVEATAKTKRVPKPKQAPTISPPFPKQAPATPD
jgi:cell division protease FtsH